MQRIDLHTHTTYSDGTKSPEELVAEAGAIGLSAIAVTDHDTDAGLDRAVLAGRSLGLTVIRGCELSATTEYGELHILGLFLPEKCSSLAVVMRELREKRRLRNAAILEKLCALGLPLTEEEVHTIAGCGTVGRPHIARALLKKGYVVSCKEAFRRYIGRDCPAFVPKEPFAPEEACEILAQSGATVVLAHPFLYKTPRDWLYVTIQKLIPLGLDVLEAWHTEHGPEETRTTLAWASALGLGVSGGSDYHGLNKPGVHLGKGRGNLAIGLEVLQALLDRRRAKGLPLYT